MAPSEFFVRLQKGNFDLISFGDSTLFLTVYSRAGITGGFAPPTPSEIHVLTASPQKPNILAVDSQLREDGTPNLQSVNAVPKEVSIADASNLGLVDELEGILKTIPMERPQGSEDIYGMDTSIMWGSQGFEWINGGPSGCTGGQSEVQATEEDKAKFRRAVEIVKELATK
jgi:hypothetical protein